MLSQSIFIIPPEIGAGLLSGDLIQYGGVVRDRSGQIVKHLDDVQLPAGGKKAAARVAAMLKNPRVLIPTLVAGAAAVAGISYAAARRRELAVVPECVERYNTSLGAYLEAVQEGRLDAGIIDHLISDLDAVVAYSDENGNNISLDFSTEQAAILVKIVVGSTKQLAKANAIDLSELDEEAPASEGGAVVDLRRRLEVQKKIFTDAASSSCPAATTTPPTRPPSRSLARSPSSSSAESAASSNGSGAARSLTVRVGRQALHPGDAHPDDVGGEARVVGIGHLARRARHCRCRTSRCWWHRPYRRAVDPWLKVRRASVEDVIMVRRVGFAALLAALGVVAPAAAEIRVLNASGGLVGTPVRDDRTNLWRWTDDGAGLLVARRGQGLRVSIADGMTSRVIALDHATAVGPGGRSAVVRAYPAQVTLRAADGAVVAAAALTNPDSEMSEVVWSPDGHRAAFVVEGNVMVVDADSGAVIARVEVPGASVYGLSEQAFSSDGTALVIKVKDQVMRLDVASGALTALAALPRGLWDPPAWSPSGPIAISADRVLLFGAPLAEIDSAHPDLPVLWTPDGNRLTYMQWDYPGRCADPRGSLRTVLPGSPAQTLFATSSRIKAWAWSPDGQHVAVALARDPNKRGKRRPWPRHIPRRFEMFTRAGDAAVRRVIVRAANGLRHGAGRAKTMQRVRLGLDPIDRRYDEAQDTAVQEAIAAEIERWLHAAGFAGLGATDELDC